MVKDYNNGGYLEKKTGQRSEEVGQQVKEEVKELKKKVKMMNILIGGAILILVAVLIVGPEIARRYVEKLASEKMTVTAQREEDPYDDYIFGALGMSRLITLKNDMIQFYRNGDITEKKMQEYVEATLNIINLALSDSEISPEEIEKYNDIIKEIPLIEYDRYQLKSTGENFRRGLKGWMIAYSSWQIVTYYDYYRKQIPEKEYKVFIIIVESNLWQYEEENCTTVIEYGRELIEDYVGDPDAVLMSYEWRTFTGMPEK